MWPHGFCIESKLLDRFAKVLNPTRLRMFGCRVMHHPIIKYGVKVASLYAHGIWFFILHISQPRLRCFQGQKNGTKIKSVFDLIFTPLISMLIRSMQQLIYVTLVRTSLKGSKQNNKYI